MKMEIHSVMKRNNTTSGFATTVRIPAHHASFVIVAAAFSALLGSLLSIVVLTESAQAAEHTRVTYPSAIGVEVLGRAGLWSVFFDQVVSDELSVGVGYGGVPLQTLADADLGTSAKLLPVYGNYYFTRQAGSLFGTAGIDVVFNSADTRNAKANPSGAEFGTQSILPSIGLGYENRTDTGFLFRLTGYALIGHKVSPWVGVSFGYAAF